MITVIMRSKYCLTTLHLAKKHNNSIKTWEVLIPLGETTKLVMLLKYFEIRTGKKFRFGKII